MTAYYNEIDHYAAQWLRNLIATGLIAPGDVDDRSIVDVKADDLRGYTQCHFFAGVGVWSYALRLAGWPDTRPVWTGSCPCQPFSSAGKRGGFDDNRHLWPAWFELIAQCRPATVFGEQVASVDGLTWLDAVQTDLESADYSVGAADLCAAGVGAPHIRQRLWFVAYAACIRQQRERRPGEEGVAKPGLFNFWADAEWLPCVDGKMRPTKPGLFPLAHGAPARVGRLRAYGNAIVAPVAETFIKAAMEI